MDEQAWLAGADVDVMLRHVRSQSDRKLRLFQVACCRRIWEWIPAGPFRDAVDIAERYAEGAANDRQRTAAARSVRAFPTFFDTDWVDREARDAVELALDKTMGGRWTLGSARVLARVAERGAPSRGNESQEEFEAAWRPYQAAGQAVYRAGQAAECELLRCIFGNPFRPVVVDPQWLAWREATIPRLAQTMIEQGSYHELPILGDALEEAGCEEAAVLAHCRDPGPHVHGCWVVDLMLGKS